jgi:4-oxalmesaconate hydratase
MIIDCHGHVSPPQELWVYKAKLSAHRGAHGRGSVEVTDEEIIAALHKKEMAPCGHLECLDEIGTDLQLISPRPFQMMHSEESAKLVQWWTEEVNNIIHRQTQLLPDRFVGIAGLPQSAGHPIEIVLPELERCVTRLGFKGVLLNPDPYENRGTKAPPMGDRYWYPLYEKLCELDVPAHIHATNSWNAEREPYSLHFINEETTAVYGFVKSSVFDDFPDLKIVVSHGGGAIPYQIGRFEAGMRGKSSFRDKLRNLYFDTVLYSPEALKLLVDVVGADRCVYATECPGTGSSIDPRTGRSFDNVKAHFDAMESLSSEDRQLIYEGNARRIFKL